MSDNDEEKDFKGDSDQNTGNPMEKFQQIVKQNTEMKKVKPGETKAIDKDKDHSLSFKSKPGEGSFYLKAKRSVNDPSLFKFTEEDLSRNNSEEDDTIALKFRQLEEENKMRAIKKVDINVNRLDPLRKKKEEELARIKREEEDFRKEQLRKRREEEEEKAEQVRKEEERKEQERIKKEREEKEEEEMRRKKQVEEEMRQKEMQGKQAYTEEDEKLILMDNKKSIATKEEEKESKNQDRKEASTRGWEEKEKSKEKAQARDPQSPISKARDLRMNFNYGVHNSEKIINECTNFNKLFKVSPFGDGICNSDESISDHPLNKSQDEIATNRNLLHSINMYNDQNDLLPIERFAKRRQTCNFLQIKYPKLIEQKKIPNKKPIIDRSMDFSEFKQPEEPSGISDDEYDKQKDNALFLPQKILRKKGELVEDSYQFELFENEDNTPLPLLEYDQFYKEKFYQDELFKIGDRVNLDEHIKEMEREVLKGKIKAKKKKYDLEKQRGIERDLEHDKEYKQLQREEHLLKKMDQPELEMKICNKDALLYKSRLLYNYFNERELSSIPKFCKESQKEIKGKEILDFTSLTIDERVRRYYDRCCCLELRRKIYKMRSYISNLCYGLVKNEIFDNFSLLIIIVNTIFILISDPTQKDSIANTTDYYFLYFYTFEAILKIMAFGFLFDDEAYIREVWNILDFTVIVMGWVSFVIDYAMSGSKIQGLAGLRAFRILRPLKTVKSIKGLKNLVVALIASLSKLSDTSMVLFFFFLIFAIAGVQMWSGMCLKRCMSLNYGYVYDYSNYTTMCTWDSDCDVFSTYGNQFICVKSTNNPNNEVINFDNALNAFITVFVIATMEGWTDVWNYISRTFKDQFYINPVIIFLYFHVLLFVGGYYLINLFLAVTKTEFTKIQKNPKDKIKKKSFYQLIHLKYDPDEKKKRERKKRIQEAKKKIHKSGGENFKEMKERIKKEAFHIKRNIKDVPLNYNTVKDIYILNKNKASEICSVEKQIKAEENEIKVEIKKKLENISKMIEERKAQLKALPKIRRSSLIEGNTIILERNSKKKASVLISKNEQKTLNLIIKDHITSCIKETLLWFANEIGKKKINDQSHSVKGKEKSKKKDDIKVNQFSIQEDLSFEKDKKQMEELERAKQEEKKNIPVKKSPTSKKSTLAVPGPQDSKNVTSKRKTPQDIANELSFLSELTVEEFEENEQKVLDTEDKIKSDKFQEKQKTLTHAPKPTDEKRKTHQKEKSSLSLAKTVSFPKPNSLLPLIIRSRNEDLIQERLEERRKKFDVNEYIASLSAAQVSKLGKRRSYLEFLKYRQETENFDDFFKGMPSSLSEISISPQKALTNLDVSLYKEESFKVDSQSLSDMDMIPAEIPNENKVYDECCDIEDMSKKLENNKYVSLARRSFFGKKGRRSTLGLTSEQMESINKTLSININNNIIIDMKEPRRKIKHSRSQMVSRMDGNMGLAQELTRSMRRELNYSGNDSAASINFYKSPSLEKNYFKYPQLDKKEIITKDSSESATKDKKEQIPDHLRSRKHYMNYLNNIIPKDIKIRNDFKVDLWRHEVLGSTKKEEKPIKLPQDRNPIYAFNDKKLNLKKYEYIYPQKHESKEEDFMVVNHSLKNFSSRAIELMPSKTVTRARGNAGYNISKSLTKSSSKFLASSRRSIGSGDQPAGLSTFGSGLHKSKSSISHSSSHRSYRTYFDDLKFKKGLMDKMYRKIDEFNYRTVAHYFLEEEKLAKMLITDEKRREEREKTQEEENSNKEKMLEVKKEIKEIKIYDAQTNSRKFIQWSGMDVGNISNVESKIPEWKEIIRSLESFDIVLWKEGKAARFFQKIIYGFYVISVNSFFDYLIMLIVIVNAVIMALDGNLLDPETLSSISLSNYVFNSIFIAEFVIKFIGLGPIVYFSDAFTYLDLFIISFAILDMTSDDSGSNADSAAKISSQLSFLRVFRIFRVLRLAKVLRKMKSMRFIITSIKKSLKDVSYIILILIMFILIFQLLGMSLLNSDQNYQSFMSSFYITFQVLTVENWNQILYNLVKMSLLIFLYLLVWIFIGNYILFNLFVSVLLQSFEGEKDADDDDEDIFEKNLNLPESFKTLKIGEKMKKMKNKKKQNEGKEKEEKHNTIEDSRSKEISAMSSITYSEDEEENQNLRPIKIDEEEEYEDNRFTGMEKTIKSWEKVNKQFKRVECEDSLYIFSQLNWLRMKCMSLQSHKTFDNIILLMILLSTLRLILDTFISGSLSVYIFDMVDIFFTVVFLFEMVVKIIALGFILDEGSYIRDNWNKIDFIIVIVSIIDLQNLISKYSDNSNGGSSLNFLKVLRLLRTLRPLRFISHNYQLKQIITSLFESILPIMNVLFIVIMVFFMFSIVGMNLFYDLYHTCYYTDKNLTPFVPVENNNFTLLIAEANISKTVEAYQNYCGENYNGVMDAGPQFKFSNIFTSIITCYVLSNMEGWPDIMNSYRSFNDYYGIFFVVYIVVVSYFFLNLFVGIMFKYFNLAWSKEKKVSENDKYAVKYYDFLKQIEFAQPDAQSFQKPEEGTIRFLLYKIAESKYLDNFIMIVIVLNMITMAMNYEGSSPLYDAVLNYINLVFTSIFIAECILKLFAFGIQGYFYVGWNRFDFFVVVSSIVDLVMDNAGGINASFLKSFQIIRVLRVLRVTRVLRLVKSLKGLEKLLQTLRWSITALSNIFILMFLVFCICAILGCYLYDGIKYKDYSKSFQNFNEFFNFDNFYQSFILCFRSVTGENWPTIMNELANGKNLFSLKIKNIVDPINVSPMQAMLYMIIMNFVTYVIMLNLFLLVTLQQYEEFTNKKTNPVEKFEKFLTEFKKAWNKYSNIEDNGYRCKKVLITNFIMEFEWSKMEFEDDEKTLESVKKYVSELMLRVDQENYVYFHDVLFRIIMKGMGGRIDRNKENSVITDEEDRLEEKIRLNIATYRTTRTKPENPLSTFNPLTSHLYYKISFLYLKNFIKIYNEKIADSGPFQNDDSDEKKDSQNISYSSHLEQDKSSDKKHLGDNNQIISNNKKIINETEINPKENVQPSSHIISGSNQPANPKKVEDSPLSISNGNENNLQANLI